MEAPSSPSPPQTNVIPTFLKFSLKSPFVLYQICTLALQISPTPKKWQSIMIDCVRDSQGLRFFCQSKDSSILSTTVLLNSDLSSFEGPQFPNPASSNSSIGFSFRFPAKLILDSLSIFNFSTDSAIQNPTSDLHNSDSDFTFHYADKEILLFQNDKEASGITTLLNLRTPEPLPLNEIVQYYAYVHNKSIIEIAFPSKLLINILVKAKQLKTNYLSVLVQNDLSGSSLHGMKFLRFSSTIIQGSFQIEIPASTCSKFVIQTLPTLGNESEEEQQLENFFVRYQSQHLFALLYGLKTADTVFLTISAEGLLTVDLHATYSGSHSQLHSTYWISPMIEIDQEVEIQQEQQQEEQQNILSDPTEDIQFIQDNSKFPTPDAKRFHGNPVQQDVIQDLEPDIQVKSTATQNQLNDTSSDLISPSLSSDPFRTFSSSSWLSSKDSYKSQGSQNSS